MSWHADDEKSLGVNPTIASVSFGEVRKFGVKHRYEKDLASLGHELASGSLVVMKGEMQEFWHHRIHPTKKLLGPRINLTFRKVFM
jgi:alkylated DNA repair dioxygenase AlkB